MHETPSRLTLELRGPAGEPVDFRRAARSHGLTTVAPFAVSDDGHRLSTVVRLPDRSARAVDITAEGPDSCRVDVTGSRLDASEVGALHETLVRMLALDGDLSTFYSMIEHDPLLSWARSGAGRVVRSQTVFEDVVRTICTTNCTFATTRRMIETTVVELGEQAEGSARRAFPTPERMARAGSGFFRDRARAGYRADHIATIAAGVADGTLDLEALRPSAGAADDDEDIRAQLLELPGIGPYAAAHVMMLIGRHSRPVLDSWSRPAFARVAGRELDDRAICARFSRFGPHAGLAFWLVVTRGWID